MNTVCSFGYAGLDSSREETRHYDGSVRGKYSYTNPDGKLVHVQYTADALNGFNAIGDDLPATNANANAEQIQQQHHAVVQDTPAVVAARQRFFETYARELARVNAAATGGTTPINVEHSVTSTTSHSSPSTATHSHVVTTTAGGGSGSGTAVPPTPARLTSTGTDGYSVAGFDSNRYGALGGYGLQQQVHQYTNTAYNNNNPAKSPCKLQFLFLLSHCCSHEFNE